jgi:hypothetical protein
MLRIELSLMKQLFMPTLTRIKEVASFYTFISFYWKKVDVRDPFLQPVHFHKRI